MEAEVFSKKHSVDECMNQLSIYSSCVAITDGENGSFVFDGQSKIHSRGVQTKAIDTNGAGDMFAGYFIKNYISLHYYPSCFSLFSCCYFFT